MEERGLTSAEVAKMVEKGKVNVIENKASKTVKQIIISNVVTYFNMVFAFLTVLLMLDI